jgi:hypothetical protein
VLGAAALEHGAASGAEVHLLHGQGAVILRADK